MGYSLESKLVRNLIDECENIRRREASDVEDEDFNNKEFPYIDTNNYVDTVSSDNNTLILGRRGCGKTSLLLKVTKENMQSGNPKLIIIKDMQSMKKNDYEIVICKLLLAMLNKMEEYVCNNIWPNVSEQYEKRCQGFSRMAYLFARKRNAEVREKYNDICTLLYSIDVMKKEITEISKLEKELKYKVSLNYKRTNTLNENSKITVAGKCIAAASINVDLLDGMGIIKSDIEIGTSAMKAVSEELMESQEESLTREDEIVKQRTDIVEDQKEKIISLLKWFYELTKKKIVFMLDDFYQIKINNQPPIIQFFHDISKECPNRGFRFKLFAIPGRLRLNDEGTDMSYKDDFSPVTVDTDVSEIDFLIKHLSGMLSEISKSLDSEDYLSGNDILDLFVRNNNEEVFTYLILAAGAVPRDFIVLFRSVVLAATTKKQDKVKKENVYDVVKNLRMDKDKNVENDSSLSEEMIDLLRREIESRFAEIHKTNVFLIPLSDANDVYVEIILRNLENLRYIYLIKDNITSEKTKQSCKAYMIDMSFCVAGSRKKNNFEIRRYWEKTAKSSVLRQSVVWSFSKDIVDKVKAEVEQNKLTKTKI